MGISSNSSKQPRQLKGALGKQEMVKGRWISSVTFDRKPFAFSCRLDFRSAKIRFIPRQPTWEAAQLPATQ